MPNQFSGPGMTLDKMRALGVRSIHASVAGRPSSTFQTYRD